MLTITLVQSISESVVFIYKKIRQLKC
uniref:Uncharacterized protein n=1 Tax=Arundo donax TaxID=35708 RepID=A0A0A9FND5_ARUDO